MTSPLFRVHGEFCATHPWEVIVATLTLTVCMLTVEHQQHQQVPLPTSAASSKSTLSYCAGCLNEAEYNAADLIVMTLIRCLAVLYCYYQFCILHRLGSKYILGIAGLFTVFSSFVFTSTVLNFLSINVSELKDALFFFLLLIDLSKAAVLAEFALISSNQEEVKNNIARGMSLLGPSITLDTLVETLVIGIGTLSGVHRLEMLSYFACLSVIVNYAIFMTFYPACLSLILELSRTSSGKRDLKSSLICRALKDEDHKSNPVIQRVKVIMSAGLMLVHAHSWWPYREVNDNIAPLVVEQRMTLNRTEENALQGYIMKWVTLSADHIVILILLLALIVKFIFFENTEDVELRVHMSEGRRRRSRDMTHDFSGDNKNLTRRFIGMRFFKHTPTFHVDANDWDNKETELVDKECQTDGTCIKIDANMCETITQELQTPLRSLCECLAIYRSNFSAAALTDEEVIMLVDSKHIPAYQLEKAVDNSERGVRIRRKIFGERGNIAFSLPDIPYMNYDYKKVMGACCENVIGYIPIPLGVAGPLLLDGREIYVLMATTEGCLVASTNRGCRALLNCGIKSSIVGDGMTRGPVVRFSSLQRASEVLHWMESPDNFAQLKITFDSSSRFARLQKIQTRLIGRLLYIRFVAKTGDAMGMNMLSKGTELALKYVRNIYPDMEILSLSGNFCTDKKPAAINWIEGRGKSVVCEAIVPAEVISNILKTSASALVEVNIAKNMIGSAVAGSIGGFNAHAANLVTAVFIATGQDPAQNVSSSNCMTMMETFGSSGEDLYISCTMPSVEVGTVGGGTILAPQAACLEMLGIKGPNTKTPGENANQLARIVCATVLAGELSLMAALAAGHLVQSHLRHNRSSTTISQELTTPKACERFNQTDLH